MSSRDGALLEAAPANPDIKRPRRRIPRARILATAAAWSSVWWLIIGALIAPLVPGHWLTIAVAVLLSVAPLLVILERFSGTYASAATRIWIFRPFLYIQLGTPLVALTAAAGTILGALIGRGIAAGAMDRGDRKRVVRVGCDPRLHRLAPAPRQGARCALSRSARGARWIAHRPAHRSPPRSAHPGPHIRRIVNAVEAAQPDAIVFTGDQVDDDARDVEAFGQAFGSLRAPLGVFAVAGNHDVYAGWPEVRAGLEALGIIVLVNRAVERSRGGASFWIAGTGDPAAGGPMGRDTGAGPDIERTLAGIPAARSRLRWRTTRRSSRRWRNTACRSR